MINAILFGKCNLFNYFFSEEAFDNYSLFYTFRVSVVVKEELDLVQQHPDLCNRTVPILFYGNKSDIEDSLSNVKIAAGTSQIKFFLFTSYKTIRIIIKENKKKYSAIL